jgi:hypothetical protein
MSIEATLFVPPNARREQTVITKINPEDSQWFKDNGAKIALEEISTGDVVVYADTGMRTEEGDEVEAIEVSGSRTCPETMAALRKQCEQMLTQWPDKIVTN